MWPVKTQASVVQTVQIAFVDSCFVFNNLNFQFILFKTECSYQTSFAHLSFCLKAVFSDNIWSSIELVINSDNTFGDNYQKLLIFSLHDICRYLTIFNDISQCMTTETFTFETRKLIPKKYHQISSFTV